MSLIPPLIKPLKEADTTLSSFWLNTTNSTIQLRMLERIDTLEAILDTETPDWRKRNGIER